jgi:predicted nucleic acid-binding Zn ribbon protein
VLPIQHFSTGVLAEILRRQPPSAGRTNLAWQIAVGPALARVTTVALAEGVLTVLAADDRWTQEIRRSRSVVLERLQRLLGSESVQTLRL